MCDVNYVDVAVVLGKCKETIFHSIYYYASKALAVSQINQTITEKDMLVIVYAFDKFRAYLVGTEVLVHTDHVASICIFNKKKVQIPG